MKIGPTSEEGRLLLAILEERRDRYRELVEVKREHLAFVEQLIALEEVSDAQ